MLINSDGLNFPEWWLALQQLAAGRRFPINTSDPKSYKDYFIADKSPHEALHEEATAD